MLEGWSDRSPESLKSDQKDSIEDYGTEKSVNANLLHSSKWNDTGKGFNVFSLFLSLVRDDKTLYPSINKTGVLFHQNHKYEKHKRRIL
ncbi:hypothetical protein TNCT_115481 [Trichonephila clavata]|uniref:Uncharacterized protein n=1 Tax=Trichonephila clavata TaxID=2740835 RepID=A0A8X6F7V0_TRICU|nr:hypothetical protein TNCT_115481 [Trichonephila clavata]